MLSNSKTACEVSGHQVADHFVAGDNMTDIDFGTQIPAYLALLERTIPDKPRSSRQKYRLTEAGKRVLETPK